MNQGTPLIRDHINTIFTYEQQLHQMIPTLLQQIDDDKLQTALTDLLQLTMHNSQRLGELSSLMDTQLQQQKSQAVQALIAELQNRSQQENSPAEQTYYMSLLHKYLGHLYTDYTYALNLVENTGQESNQALELLRKSLDELKATNNRLSSLADKKIKQLKEARAREQQRLEAERKQQQEQQQMMEKTLREPPRVINFNAPQQTQTPYQPTDLQPPQPQFQSKTQPTQSFQPPQPQQTSKQRKPGLLSQAKEKLFGVRE